MTPPGQISYNPGQMCGFMVFSVGSWACSKVALHGIRIAEAGVRFSPGPHVNHILDGLNDKQVEAVKATDGPVLVISGPVLLCSENDIIKLQCPINLHTPGQKRRSDFCEPTLVN